MFNETNEKRATWSSHGQVYSEVIYKIAKKKKLYPTIMTIAKKGREKVSYTCRETNAGNWQFEVQT